MIKHIYKVFSLVALTALLLACRTERTTEQAEIVVTIAPLKYIVEQITEGKVEVGVLVPAGASPETFDPTPRQMARVESAKLLLTTGLIDFEKNLLERVGTTQRIADLSQGVELIAGSHSHSHETDPQGQGGEHHNGGEHHDEVGSVEQTADHHAHHHGVDPHIWTSPRELKTMAQNVYAAIKEIYPDRDYSNGFQSLMAQLDDLDRDCRQLFDRSSTKAFVIYHPALTYLARAYGLEQIAIEDEGKEPSARDIARIIDRAREGEVKVLLYQIEYPRSMVDIVARDMGVEPMQINPLEENPIQFIEQVTHLITGE